MTLRVFISHSSANAELALAFCSGLEARGLATWIAPRDVKFTGTYGPEIIKGIREADVGGAERWKPVILDALKTAVTQVGVETQKPESPLNKTPAPAPKAPAPAPKAPTPKR